MGGEGKLDFGLRTCLSFNGKEHHIMDLLETVTQQIPFCMHMFGFLHEKGCLAPVLARLAFVSVGSLFDHQQDSIEFVVLAMSES